jgi:hypothetical protein
MFHGSLVWWAVSQEGAAEPHIQRDIETLIGPYRTTPATASSQLRFHGRSAQPPVDPAPKPQQSSEPSSDPTWEPLSERA